jgi:hypothetical protein
VAGLAILTVFPASILAQEDLPCSQRWEGYLNDRSLNAHMEGKNTIVMHGGGREYVCRCVADNRPLDCKPRDSSGAAGAGSLDVSGQDLALKAAQSLIAGLVKSIFSTDESAASAEDALKQRQELLKKQEEERAQALKSWELYQKSEKERALREQQMRGQELLAQIGGAGGQGLDFQSISGAKLGFNQWAAQKPGAPLSRGRYPAPTKAVEQVRCAAYFSEGARELSGLGRQEDAQLMSLQAQKAMSGDSLDLPCRAARAGVVANSGAASRKAESQAMAAAMSEILNQYNAKIKELLELSRKLGEVRKEKLDVEVGLSEIDVKIADVKSRTAAATKPEEKQQLDDLLNEALALRGESEARLKTAEENESAYLASARQTESAVKELSSKLQAGKDKK